MVVKVLKKIGYFSAEMRPYLGKKSKNQKIKNLTWHSYGEAYFVGLGLILALEIDLELSFFDWDFFKNKNFVL